MGLRMRLIFLSFHALNAIVEKLQMLASIPTVKSYARVEIKDRL